MTLPEFIAWHPEEKADRRWQLIDGEPVCMAPASEKHGAIQREAARLIGDHPADKRPICRVITAPGVNFRVRLHSNVRGPDLTVVCGPATGSHLVSSPVLLLLEIPPPSNEAETWANVWAYAITPSVVDILLLSGV